MISLLRYSAQNSSRLTSNLLYEKTNAGILARSEFFETPIVSTYLDLTPTTLPINSLQVDASLGQVFQVTQQQLTVTDLQSSVSIGNNMAVVKQSITTVDKVLNVSYGNNITVNKYTTNIQEQHLGYSGGVAVNVLARNYPVTHHITPVSTGTTLSLNNTILPISDNTMNVVAGLNVDVLFNTLTLNTYNLTLTALNGSFNISKRRLFILKKPKQKGNNYGSW